MNLRAPDDARAGPGRRGATLGLIAACALLLAAATAVADPAGDGDPAAGAGAPGYALWWRTIDGGGASYVQQGSYTLGGTAGQPDAGDPATAGGYTLRGGFWAAMPGEYHAFIPAVMKIAP